MRSEDPISALLAKVSSDMLNEILNVRDTAAGIDCILTSLESSSDVPNVDES